MGVAIMNNVIGTSAIEMKSLKTVKPRLEMVNVTKNVTKAMM